MLVVLLWEQISERENLLHISLKEEIRKYIEKMTLQIPRSMKKEGKEALQAPEQKFPYGPWRGPLHSRLSPAAHTVPWQNRYPHWSLWRNPRLSRWMWPKESFSSWRAQAGTDLRPELQLMERCPWYSRWSGRSYCL